MEDAGGRGSNHRGSRPQARDGGMAGTEAHTCSDDTTVHIDQCQESFLIPEYPDNKALFLSKAHN